MSRKRPKKATRSPKFCVDWLATTATNQEQAISLATWLKTRFRGHLIHPQSPTFCGFHPSELPKRTPRPPYLGPLDCGKLQAQTEIGGCPNGSTGSNRGRKLTFLKNDPRPCVMLKQVFWTVLRLWWPILVLRKRQNALKMGCFGTTNGSKMGQKRIFPKLIVDHLGCTNG